MLLQLECDRLKLEIFRRHYAMGLAHASRQAITAPETYSNHPLTHDVKKKKSRNYFPDKYLRALGRLAAKQIKK